MKKLFSISPYSLIFINLFAPICEIIARIISFRFELWNYAVCSGIVFILSLLPAALLFFSEKIVELNRAERIAWSVFPLVAIFNFLFFTIKSDSALAAAFALLNLILSLYFAKKLGVKLAFRVGLISSIPFVLLASLLILLRPMASWASGKTAVKESSYSPNGECYVEFVERSTGATGGEVTVRLYRKNFDVYAFSFRRKPEILYTGAWGEDVKLEWLDDSRLLINNEEYSIAK